ncbi:hypothetical protein GOP47_0022309, partial [Adiantum capillus-veneris]
RRIMVRGLSRAVRGVAKQSRKKKRREEGEEEWDGSPPSGPRSFPLEVKELCWQKAETVKGRDPARWRRDPVGNLVFRKLVGCSGCLCYDFDHVVPYSKAAANRAKGNRVDISKAELAQKSVYCRLSGRDMDVMEMTAYGDVHHEPGGCNIQ